MAAIEIALQYNRSTDSIDQSFIFPTTTLFDPTFENRMLSYLRRKTLIKHLDLEGRKLFLQMAYKRSNIGVRFRKGPLNLWGKNTNNHCPPFACKKILENNKAYESESYPALRLSTATDL